MFTLSCVHQNLLNMVNRCSHYRQDPNVFVGWPGDGIVKFPIISFRSIRSIQTQIVWIDRIDRIEMIENFTLATGLKNFSTMPILLKEMTFKIVSSLQAMTDWCLISLIRVSMVRPSSRIGKLGASRWTAELCIYLISSNCFVLLPFWESKHDFFV